MPINSPHLFEVVVVVVFWMTMRINHFCRGVDEVPECVVVIRAGSFIVPSLDDMGEVDVPEKSHGRTWTLHRPEPSKISERSDVVPVFLKHCTSPFSETERDNQVFFSAFSIEVFVPLLQLKNSLASARP